MAVTTTPLGFQKPDGNEMVRDGDNIIGTNADVADGLHNEARFRLDQIEAASAPPVTHEPRPSNLGLAPDGIPYIQAGLDTIRVYAGTDGSYYFTPA